MTTTATQIRARTAEMTPENVTTFARAFSSAGFDAHLSRLHSDPAGYGEVFGAWLDQLKTYADCLSKAR